MKFILRISKLRWYSLLPVTSSHWHIIANVYNVCHTLIPNSQLFFTNVICFVNDLIRHSSELLSKYFFPLCSVAWLTSGLMSPPLIEESVMSICFRLLCTLLHPSVLFTLCTLLCTLLHPSIPFYVHVNPVCPSPQPPPPQDPPLYKGTQHSYLKYDWSVAFPFLVTM